MRGHGGEIVGSGFINTVVPFIRCRAGDYATHVGEHCEAWGRDHTIIHDTRGHRTLEMLVAADGSEISWTALNMHDDTFLHVRQFQFYQDTPGRAVLRVVPAETFGDASLGEWAASPPPLEAGWCTRLRAQGDAITDRRFSFFDLQDLPIGDPNAWNCDHKHGKADPCGSPCGSITATSTSPAIAGSSGSPRRVTRWKAGAMALRSAATPLVQTEKHVNRSMK